MDTEALFAQIDRLIVAANSAASSSAEARGVKAQVCEFFRKFAGPKSAFYSMAEGASGMVLAPTLAHILQNFRAYVQAGLAEEIAPLRRAQLDVVSDFLEQARTLLDAKAVHPAAPIVLIGATLEEFLRNWVETQGLSLGQRKPSLDTYAQVLMAEALITKQDMKDITAWGGLRNHAAHGEWAEVTDKQRAAIMLEGVNLFMRKYGAA